ncbi:MAG: hypothetical protein V7708_16665 [Oceanicoccus sp.]
MNIFVLDQTIKTCAQFHCDQHVGKMIGARFESIGLTPFAQAMPESYKIADDPVAADRDFYCGEKADFATWKKRKSPD